jgi:hypothetical protein
MSDSQAAAQSAQQPSLSIAAAAEKLRVQREAQQSKSISDSDAAGKLAEQRAAGDLSAEAQRAKAEVKGGEPDEGDEAAPVVSTESAIAAAAAADDGLIDLGDGLKVTLDQVREGFMLKADHTRKTQALAEERRALERDRKDKLSRLDEALTRFQEPTGPSKPLQAFLAEDPANGLRRFVEHIDRQQRIAIARELAKQERADHLAAAGKLRDEKLRSDYWPSKAEAETGVADAAAYAKSYGYDDAALTDLLTDPSVIMVLDKARKFDELQAGKARIERIVADKPKVVKPGAKVSTQVAVQSAADAARSKLKASGSLSDAVAYLQAQRKATGRQ